MIKEGFVPPGGLRRLFVPQKCGEDLCTMKQIIESYDKFTKTILIFNFITLTIFFTGVLQILNVTL